MTPPLAKEPEMAGLREKLEELAVRNIHDPSDDCVTLPVYEAAQDAQTVLARQLLALMESEQGEQIEGSPSRCGIRGEHEWIEILVPPNSLPSPMPTGVLLVFPAAAILGTESENGANDG